MWLHSQQSEYQSIALSGLQTDFQRVQGSISGRLPAEYTLSAVEFWVFELKGDELWISAPSLEKKMGTLAPEDFDLARKPLQQGFVDWLRNRPGKPEKFPIKLKFRNESATPTPPPRS